MSNLHKYLGRDFGFGSDAPIGHARFSYCAEIHSPEGVLRGVLLFLFEKGQKALFVFISMDCLKMLILHGLTNNEASPSEIGINHAPLLPA